MFDFRKFKAAKPGEIIEVNSNFSNVPIEVVAWYVIEQCRDNGYPITTPNLQNVLFLIQEHYIKIKKELLFYSPVYAYSHGPIYPTIRYNQAIVTNITIPIDRPYAHIIINDKH